MHVTMTVVDSTIVHTDTIVNALMAMYIKLEQTTATRKTWPVRHSSVPHSAVRVSSVSSGAVYAVRQNYNFTFDLMISNVIECINSEPRDKTGS